ncbi:MAG: response regulator [Armatimonadota bacterium]|nr:MAG: response regulator [Armatimonadota bacterium]
MTAKQGISVLIVDDDKALLGVLQSVLEAEGHRVEIVPSAYDALPRLDEERYDLVLVDLKMRRMDGLELLEHERLQQRGTRMVIMTAYPTVDTAVQAMRQGAFDYLVKPFKLAELRAVVERASAGDEPEQPGAQEGGS